MSLKKSLTALLCALVLSPVQAETTDVVVIGSGGAGLSAAITAAQADKKVIVLEKELIIGGNTNRAEGGINAAGSRQQVADGITNDSPMQMALDTQKGGHYLNNPELVMILAENSRRSQEWLLELGANLCHKKGRGAGSSVARDHSPCDGGPVGVEVMRVLYGKAKELPGISIRTASRAVGIIKTGGRISGVKVQDTKNGGEYTIDARAVVLATGGFGSNAALVESLRPEYRGFASTNHPGATGDGLKLARGVGATFVDLREIQAHPTVVYGSGTLISESLRARGAYLVNSDGRRFINELLPRDVVAAGVLAQPGGTAWIVYDDALVKSNRLARGFTARDFAVHGTTPEELASAMKVPAGNLKATIIEYAKAFKTQKDEAFGRPDMVTPNNVFPMTAILITPGIHHCMGGVRINTKGEVIGVDAKPIPGLWAAGEVTGGVHGGNRLGGNAVADIITFGRIAGKNAAEYLN